MIRQYDLQTDVVVLGSGPAGFAAAIAAKQGRNLNDISAAEIRELIGI